MPPATKNTRPAAILLLVAALLADTFGDRVTWRECGGTAKRELARGDQDNNATELSLSSCNIDQLTVDDLQGLPEIHSIALWLNNLRQLDSAVFRNTPQVTHLDVAINKLSAVPVFGSDSVLPNLSWLSFNNNKITKLDDPKTFASTKKLEWLTMSGNQIEYIHPEMFKGLSKIQYIALGNNRLTYIPDKMFDMQSLHYLYLESNLIEYIAPAAFRTSRLSTLHLQQNRLTHMSDNFIASVAASSQLDDFCYHNNPWQCAYLLAQINVTKNIMCAKQATVFDGTEVVCSSCALVGMSDVKK